MYLTQLRTFQMPVPHIVHHYAQVKMLQEVKFLYYEAVYEILRKVFHF